MSTPDSHRWLPVALFGAILLLLCLLRFPLPHDPAVRDVDESVSALIASNWLAGGVPYRDAIDQRGPVTYALYAAVFLIAGDGAMGAVHGALLLLIFLGCWLTWKLARSLAPESAGTSEAALAAVLLAFASFTYRPSQLLAFHTEWPIVVFSTLGMLLTWRATRPGRSAPVRDLALAGAAFGLAFLSKQPALFDGLAAGLFVLWLVARRPEPVLPAAFRLGGALAGGFLATVALAAGYFALHGALGDFYLYFWSYNVEHYTAVVPVAERWAALNPFGHRRHYLTANPWLFAGVVAAAGFALWGRFRRSPRTNEPGSRALVLLWFAAAYFGASYSGRNFGHYFIQILVPACLLTADVTMTLWRAGGRLIRTVSPDRGWLLRGAVLLLGLGGLVFSLRTYGGEASILRLGEKAKVDPTLERLLGRVQELSRPDDTIFVWGYYPEIYLLAPRRPASRYSNTNYLTGMLPWENHAPGLDTSEHIVPGAWDILVRELTAARPPLVIDTVPGNHRHYRKYPIAAYPPLAEFLARGYRRVAPVLDERGRPYFDLYVRNDSAAQP
ncbi:MAG: glycosyltransferase family 39 protein [Thermoanaerobaculia bacterium]|nr:glycosyltransferase family 39 protein [Thermoanaerobaculia bacterium]